MPRFSIIPARAYSDPDLPRAALVVLGALGVFNIEGAWFLPDVDAIGKMLAYQKQAVRQQIKVLTELGYIEGFGALYRINFDDEAPNGSALAHWTAGDDMEAR